MNNQAVTKVAGASRKFGWFFKFSFLSIFLAYLFIHAVAVAIETKDVSGFVTTLGKEFLSPLESASNQVDKLYAYDSFSFGFLFSLWGLYFELYKIYLWLRIIMKLIVNPLLGEWSFPWIIGMGVVLTIFYVIQMFYILIVTKGSINEPFIYSGNILKGLLHLASNIKVPNSVRNLG